MITIPKTISMEFVRSLTPTDVREILENASETIIDHIIALLPMPTQEDNLEAHQFLDDGIYDSCGNIIGEKHLED